MELYINIRENTKQDIDIYFDLQSQSEDNGSITIALTNFKDKNGEDIIAKILGVKFENDDNSQSYKFTIDKKEVIKVQFDKKSLIQNYDFNEIHFDIIIGNDIYSFIWNYNNKNLTKYIKNKKEMK